MERKNIIVAGASSGLGLAVARGLAGEGHTVYAGARSFREPSEESVGAAGGVMKKSFLDVTDDASVARFIDGAVRDAGQIDVLVNCAALIILGAVEDLTMEELGRVMDTNFMGTVRACRRVLPHMRVQGRGLIVNFSSGAGLIGIPFQGAYCASKSAIEGFSETLRWEVKTRGIDVVIVEPGDNNAGSEKYRLHAQNAGAESPYAEDFRTVTQKIASDEANGAGPEAVAKTVCRIVEARRPRIRYRVFRLMENLLPLKQMLPTGIVEAVFFGYYNMKPKKK
jgi:NAD(P)-dependent dehydrogenase (short-subunit alcohol dehydrogenase family)